MVRRGGHFGKRQPVVAPRNDMASAGNVNRGLVVAALDVTRLMDFEQFRMQGPAIKLEDQFSDFWSNGKHDRYLYE